MRVFISSPSDLRPERKIVLQVVERLAAEFKHHFPVTPVLWEHEPLLATEHFQEGLVSPADCDIVLCMLWSRLGSPLPEGRFSRTDGSPGSITGTEWEYLMAAEAHARQGKPEILVYRKTAPVQVSLDDEAALARAQAAKRELDAFFRQHFHNDDDASTFKNAYWPFATIDELEEQVYTHLAALLRRHASEDAASGGSADPPVMWHRGSPFRGLQSFEPEHADIFFGRNRARNEAFGQFRAQVEAHSPFLMLLGTSGSGKSSLIKAGLLPMLLTPGVVDGVAECRWCVMRPSEAAGDLAGGLLRALLAAHALPELLAECGGDTGALRQRLEAAPHTLEALLFTTLNTIKATTGYRTELNVRLLIVIDQFEELFSLPGCGDAERRAFVSLLASLVRSEHTWVLGTMRSDFFVHCETLPELVELMRGNGQMHLTPPSGEEIGQIIELPARAAGLSFERDEDGIGLDQVLRDRALGESAILPLLSFTLDELFERRQGRRLTYAAYRELGGIEGAITRHAESIYAALPPACQAELPGLLRLLVTIHSEDGETVAARRASREQATASAERRALVEAFVAGRLLVSSDAGGVSVAHEALLRSWRRARAWIDDNLDYLRARARIATMARSWDSEGRPAGLLLPAGRLLEQGVALLGGDSPPDDLDAAFLSASQARIEQQHAAAEAAALAARSRRRQRLLTALAGVLVAAVAVLFIIQGNQAREELQRLASEREREALDTRVRSFARLSEQQTRGGDPLNGIHLGIQAVRRASATGLEASTDARAALYQAIWAQPRRWLVAGEAHPLPVAVAPDGSSTAASRKPASARPVTAPRLLFDGPPARLLDTGSGLLRPLAGGTARLLATGAGRALLALEDSTELWDLGGEAHRQARLPPATAAAQAAFSADGTTLAVLDRGVLSAFAIGHDVRARTRLTTGDHRRMWLAPSGDHAVTAGSAGGALHHLLAGTSHVLTAPLTGADGRVQPGPLDDTVVSVHFVTAERLVSTAADGRRLLWDVATGQALAELPGVERQRELQVVAGAWLVAGVGDHAVEVHDLHSGARRAVLLHERPVRALVTDPGAAHAGPGTAPRVLAVDGAGNIDLWQVDGSRIGRLTAAARREQTRARGSAAGDRDPVDPAGAIAALATAPGRAAVRRGAEVLLLDLGDASVLLRLPVERDLQPALLAGHDRLAIRTSADSIAVHDARSGEIVTRIRPGYEIRPVALAPGRLATLALGRLLEHRDTATGKPIATALGVGTTAAGTNPRFRYLDRRRLLMENRGQTIVWDLEGAGAIRELRAPATIALAAMDDASGRLLVAAGGQLTVHHEDGRTRDEWPQDAPVTALAVTDDDGHVAVGLASGAVQLLDPGSGAAPVPAHRLPGPVARLHGLPAGRGGPGGLLAVAGDAGRVVHLLDPPGQASDSLRHWESVSALAAGDGLLVVGSGDATYVWRLDADAPQGRLQRRSVLPGLVAGLLADGTDAIVIVGEPAPTTHVVERGGDRVLGTVPLPRGNIRRHAASPDGSLLALVSSDAELQVWALRGASTEARLRVSLTAALLGLHGGDRGAVCQPSRGAPVFGQPACVLRDVPTRLVFSSDGQSVALGRDGESLLVYDTRDGRQRHGQPTDASLLGFALDNAALLLQDDAGALQSIDLAGAGGATRSPASLERMPLRPFESSVRLRGGEVRFTAYRGGSRLTQAGTDWSRVQAVLDVHGASGRALVRLHDASLAVLDARQGLLLAHLIGTGPDSTGRFSSQARHALTWTGQALRVWPLFDAPVEDVAARILAGD